MFLYRYNKNLRREDSELHKHATYNYPNAYIYLKYALPVLMFFFLFALIYNGMQVALLVNTINQ